MLNTERKYGFIIFPETEERIDNVWLNITDEEIFLEVPYSLHGNPNWSIILGVFNGLENATFIDVFASGGGNGGGGSFRKFVISWMIKHCHFNTLEQIKFDFLSLRESAFKDWNNEKFFLEEDNFTYSLPDPITPIKFDLPLFSFTWELGHTINFNFKNLEIHGTSSIITKFKELKNWDYIIDYILKLKKLLLFLTNKDPKFTDIILNDSVELIYRAPKLFSSRFPSAIKLNYQETKPHLSEIVKKWFNFKKLEPITDLVLEKHFQKDLPTHRHFFNLAVGLEAFHENFILKNVPLQNNELKENREQILKAIESNEELYLFFNNKSSEWGKPTLKDRLFHLEEIISQISSYIFEYDTIELITKIKQTRDEIAHAGVYDKRFKENIELMIVTKIIEFVLRIKIYTLFELELKTNRTDMITEANQLVKQLARLNDFKIQEKK